MSLMKARQRSVEAPAPSHDSHRCTANGCLMRGTISPSGGRYVCAVHYAAESDRWPLVTEALLQNERIALAIAEVVRMGDMEWAMGKWEMMTRYFSDEPDLQPSDAERMHRRWYEYRLHSWLFYLAGVQRRKPEPRQPLEPVKRRGNLAAALGA